MSLIHGSMGLIYFVHEWKPKFNEWALLTTRRCWRPARSTSRSAEWPRC